MALKETTGLYETLKAEWNKKNPNLNKCGDILSKLKVRVPYGMRFNLFEGTLNT